MNFIKKHKKMLTATLAAAVISFSGYIVIANTPFEVTLTIDGVTETIKTNETTLNQILLNKGYKVYDLKSDVSLDTLIEKNQKIIINTKKDVTFNNKGKTLTVSTYSTTVSDFLKEYGIKPDTEDFISPSLDANIKNGDIISYDDINIENYTKNIELEYKTIDENSFNVKFGETEIKTSGENGTKVEQYTKITKNGVVVSDRLTNSKVIKEPIDEIKLVGTKEIVEENIKKETIKRKNSSLYKGETKTIQEGKNGLIEYVYENDGNERKLVNKEVKTEAVTKIIEYGTKPRPASTGGSTVSKYSLSNLRYNGIIHWNGLKFTYYSQSILPGRGLRIPGRHVNGGGFVADENGYIVVSHRSASKGTVINTPFGYKAKVYDRCGNCASNHYDVYTK